MRAGSTLKRWFSSADEEVEIVPSSAKSERPAVTLAEFAERELMDRITEFLFSNDLRVSRNNLLVAHAAFSGEALGLARTIGSTVASGEKVSQEWIDSVAETLAPSKPNEAMTQLSQKLERSILLFEQSSSSAHKSTHEYGVALNNHVGEIEQANVAGAVMHNLAEIARSMIERTNRIEHEMERSQNEASALRKSLEKARREAELDHLTGLPNRRAFEGVFETQFRLAQADIEPLSVAFCDIDHFKRINDVHGHDTGDRVIQAVAQMLARISSDRCHVARHGGEEFVLLFRGLTLTEARDKLDQTREQLAQRRFVNRENDEPIGSVSFSAGVANVFAYSDRREALKAADEALYKAKNNGRNQVLSA